MMKRHGLLMLTFITVMAVAAAGLAAASDQIRLRLKLQEGRAYGVKVTSVQKVAQSPMGLDQFVTQTIGLGYRLEVTEVDPAGVMTVQITYDSCLFKQDSPFGAVEYDSTSPPAQIPEAARGFAALVGLGFTTRLDPTGRTVEVTGLDAMIAQMLDRMGLAAEAGRDQAALALKTQYGDNAVRRSLGGVFFQYPERSIGVGDSWTSEARISSGFPMVVASTYTLTGRRNGVATLAVHAAVAPNREAPPMDLQGMKMRYELAGEQEGTVEIDEATGLIVRTAIKTRLAGQVTAVLGTGKEDATAFPIAIEGETRSESY